MREYRPGHFVAWHFPVEGPVEQVALADVPATA